MEDKRVPMNPKTAAGDAGLVSAPKPASLLTPSSLLYPNRKSTLSPNLSSLASEQLIGLPTAKLSELVN
jgi:hypothetical protein